MLKSTGKAKLNMDGRPLHVLLVDDDEIDVMNVRRAFKKNRFSNTVHVARDGIEALEILRKDGIPQNRRLVLLDLNMPRMNGIEFLKTIRADPELALTPVVVLTTSNEDKDRTEAYKLNVAGYLLKPVQFSDFVDLMAALNKYWTLVELP
jgi:CheY-like chemotaxis protein